MEPSRFFATCDQNQSEQRKETCENNVPRALMRKPWSWQWPCYTYPLWTPLDGDICLVSQEQVSNALKQLLFCHYNRPAFSRNTALAFQILSCPTNKRKKPGLKGRVYTELLKQICGSAGPASSSLIHKLRCWDHEAVPFGVFRHGVLTCFVFLDYVKISRRLFEVVAESGEASRTVCQALLEALQDALSTSGSARGTRCLDTASKLSPDQLGHTMEQAMRLRRNETSPPMTQEDFTQLTAPLFIQRVKPMC